MRCLYASVQVTGDRCPAVNIDELGIKRFIKHRYINNDVNCLVTTILVARRTIAFVRVAVSGCRCCCNTCALLKLHASQGALKMQDWKKNNVENVGGGNCRTGN